MCGPTAAQTELTNEETAAYQSAQDMTAKQYANQQAIYAPLKGQFESIFAKGPNQKGFSAEEEQGLNAQAVEGTAENYKAAATAVNEHLGAEGGGTNPLPSGAQVQLQEQTAESAAQEESRQETEIQQADYSQGEAEWARAGGGLMGIAAGQDPVGFENAATNTGNMANTEANTIAAQQDSWVSAAIGAAGTIGGAFATGGMSLLAPKPAPCWIAAELWGWGDPRTLKLRAWMLQRALVSRRAQRLLNLYMTFGERTAEAMRQRPMLRRTMSALFEWLLRKAERFELDGIKMGRTAGCHNARADKGRLTMAVGAPTDPGQASDQMQGSAGSPAAQSTSRVNAAIGAAGAIGGGWASGGFEHP